jgi:polysaccharide biosynthesis/export protein VpsN
MKFTFLASLFLAVCLALSGGVAQAQQATLRAGDNVDIRVSGIPGDEISVVSATQTIDEDGQLNIAYIGKVKVAGMDAASAQRAIESRMVSDKIFTHPIVTVSVQSGMRLVNVTGEVKSSGRLQYTPDLTVMSAIAGAGGFSDFADRKHVKLVRAGKVQVLDTTKFSKDPSLDVKVLPGDQVYIPQAGVFTW